MSFVSKVKGLGLLVIGATGGAAASYFMDPDRGRSRRAQTADQLKATARRAADDARKQARYTAGQASGAVIEAVKPPTAPADDRALKDKVESEVLGHVDQVHTGDIVVTARDGIVELRGQVPSSNVMDEILARTRDLPGVRGVDNLLHLPGQPAPNIESAQEASRSQAKSTSPGRSLG